MFAVLTVLTVLSRSAMPGRPAPAGPVARSFARRARRAIIGYRWRRGGLSAWECGLDRWSASLDRAGIHADQELMAAIAEGDEAVFERLVRGLAPVLLRFARATLAASPAEAEEVVQEALIRLWQQAASWQPDGRISAWAYRVTYRLCIDRLRRLRPAVDLDAVADDLADPAPLPGARLARLEDVRAVQAAVAALPERQRTAIVLCHYQGLAQAEAAVVMGLGEEAYESLLARARRRLRARFADGGGEP
jgi:RNA polymerase sigma-70 factor (ECF subfamily)